MRIPGLSRKDQGARYAPLPNQVVCPVCSLRNDASARFCRNCGLPLGAPRDPVRGTTTRRADLPSERGTGIAAIVGLLAVVVILAGAGFLIFRGFNSGTAVVPPGTSAVPVDSATPTSPPGSVAPTAPPGSPAASALPTPEGTPGPSAEPTTDPTAGTSAEPTSRPTRRPTAAPTPTPASLTDTGFTCDTGSVLDATRSSWRVTEARWGARNRWDELTILMSRESGRAPKPGTTVELAWLKPGAVRSTYGFPNPGGDRALVLTFDGSATIRTSIDNSSLGMQALRSIDIDLDSSDVLHVVIGVNGDGCARLTAPDWVDGASSDQVSLVLDVKYR